MSVVGHQPPPFFRRGLPPAAKLTLYLALSLGLLIGDLQLRYLDNLRQGVAILTYPLQIAAATPGEFLHNASKYFSGLVGLEAENKRLKAEQLTDARELLRLSQLQHENDQLRGLLKMRDRVPVSATAAEVLFSARDPFSLKVIVDKGGNAGIESGLAVVDAQGVIGQVTRVFPMNAEVTLLTDKNQAIPVVIERSGLRAVMFGTGGGLMELRYLAANADVRPGDRILTSGLDGIFVPGLPVATVVGSTHSAGEPFVRIICKPIGGVEQAGSVLILGRSTGAPIRPQEEAVDPQRTISGRIHRPAAVDASAPIASAPLASAPVAAAQSRPVARPAPRPNASAPVVRPARPNASAPVARQPIP